jgi:hypothetical protein
MSTVEIESEIKIKIKRYRIQRQRQSQRPGGVMAINSGACKRLPAPCLGVAQCQYGTSSRCEAERATASQPASPPARQPGNNLPVPLTAFSPALLLSYPHTLCICCRAAVVACRPFASHRIAPHQPALQRLSLGAHTRRRRPLFTRTRRP